MLTRNAIFLCTVVVVGCTSALAHAWQPSLNPTEMTLWPGPPPDAHPVAGPEIKSIVNRLIAGRPWTQVGRVSQPTMTVHSPPTAKNTGAAVVVFPGGGYRILAIDLEGTEVCDWLVTEGITCVVLKYRVPGEGLDPKSGAYPSSPAALEDAQRAVGLVRLHASQWHVDAHKIGVLGFSAGGHLAAAISTHFDKRIYPAVDDADKESCRPDFAVVLYPGHMMEHTSKRFALNPYLPVTKETPPTFLLQAEDDPVDPVENALVYFAALKTAGVPAEMHLYAHGGHAFGLRRTKSPITEWPRLVAKWLRTIGIVEE